MRARLPFALLFTALSACAGPEGPPSAAPGADATVDRRALASEADEALLESERLRFLRLAGAAPLARLDGLASEVRRPGAGDLFEASVGAVKAAYEREGVGQVGATDIEAMAFMVLMQAARSAQEDLKAIMAQVKSVAAAREGERVVLERLEKDLAASAGLGPADPVEPAKDGCLALGVGCAKTGAAAGSGADPELVDALVRRAYDRAYGDGVKTKADLDHMIDQIKNDLDSLSEMGEMESLRLQMAMDRMSKMMSTLSNMLKKISDTSNAIIQNMK
jgi:hypothetical protein